MTEEEKMLERYAREKRKAHQKSGSLFSLGDNDDAGEETILTHYGRVSSRRHASSHRQVASGV
jgi:hypothetical protein